MKNTITEHMKLTKSQRQSHTNTFSDCVPVVRKRDTAYGKAGEYTKPGLGMGKAKETLTEYHNIESFNGNVHKVNTCHLCKNDSSAPNGFVCKNPAHLYFGTVYENHMDKPAEIRKKSALAGAKAGAKKAGRMGALSQLKSGNHNMLKRDKCIHCGFESNLMNINRWHNERCKHKP